MYNLSTDSALHNLGSVYDSTRAISGISGNSTIVPIQSSFEAYGFFWTRELINAFTASFWQCDRVISTKPYAMLNAWGRMNATGCSRSDLDKCNKWMRGLKKKYCHGQILANKDGGATMIRLVDDGRESDEPIDINNIKKVRYSRILDRWECYPDPLSYLHSPDNPEYYLIALNPTEQRHIENTIPGEKFGNLLPSNQNYYRIHRDRIVRFDGDFIDAESVKQNQGWHASKLIRFLPPLMRYLEAMGYVAAAMKSFEMVLFLVDDLFKMISTDEGKDMVLERSRINQEMISAVKGMVADRKREDVKIVSRNFSGTDKVIENLKIEMMGASGLDAIELFQEHPSGMNQTGQSQRLEKARQTKQLCEYTWGDLIEGNLSDNKIGDLDLFLWSQECPLTTIPSDYSWNWSEDIAITPEEKAKLFVLYSQGDKHYAEIGAITPEELRSRFDSDTFKDELTLNEDTKTMGNNTKPTTEETTPIVNTDAEDKLIINPLDNILLEESEYEKLLREVEQEWEQEEN